MGPKDNQDLFNARLVAGWEALQQGRIAEAEKLFEAAREGAEPLDERDPHFLQYLYLLAGTRYAQARYEEADAIVLRALALLQQVAPPANLLTVQLLMLRGDILHLYRGHHVEAERVLKEALAILLKLVRRDDQLVIVLLARLGRLYRARGLYQEAEQHLQEALTIGEQKPGPKGLELVETLDQMAHLYQIQHRYQDAFLLLKRALTITEELVGPDNYRVGLLLRAIGALCLDYLPEHEAEAYDYYVRATALLEQSFGPDHPEMLGCLDGMATMAQRVGKYKWALRLWRHSLTIIKRHYGPDHRQRATTLMKLADLFHGRGKYRQAVGLYQRALVCLRKALGPDHPQVALALAHLAVVYDDWGQAVKAEAFYQRALAISEEVLGPDHPQNKGILEKYADLLHRLGREAEATALASRARSIRVTTEGA
jgi:tetratricopeptide (TPR) repeat protein